jgi:hypothetical protein
LLMATGDLGPDVGCLMARAGLRSEPTSYRPTAGH